MAYNQFTLDKAKEQFNLTTNSASALFREVAPVEASPLLTTILEKFVPLAVAINTEKARSEWIIAPILGELRDSLKDKISLFSGITFNVDLKQKLGGVCDFMVCRSAEQYVLNAPVITIVEAKWDNVINGLGQCVVTMVAARLFNEKKKRPISPIYGVVTSGSDWKFLKLEGQTVYIDLDDYYLHDLGKIMGILVRMVSDEL